MYKHQDTWNQYIIENQNKRINTVSHIALFLKLV